MVLNQKIRLWGIDAPETRGASCLQEKLWADEAQVQLEKLYGIGTTVRIEKVELDSFGRALADVRRWRTDRWLYLAEEMSGRDMAIPWQEGDPDIDWCALAETR